MLDFKETDLPSYYTTSNKKSLVAQKSYRIAIWVLLGIMFLSTLASSIEVKSLTSLPHFNEINGWLLFVPTAISVLLLFFSPEKSWYIGRAVAESIKTLSWRFMMKSSPFDGNENDSRRIFLERIRQILQEAEKDKFLVSDRMQAGDQISKTMSDVRNLPYIEQKDFYREYRIEDQIDWYHKKSRRNKKNALVAGVAIAMFQALSATYLIWFIDKISMIDLNAIFLFVATSIISLMELYKFKELRHSYLLTEIELNLIREKFGAINSATDLDEFVSEAEQAISREHTMWLARRGRSNFLNT